MTRHSLIDVADTVKTPDPLGETIDVTTIYDLGLDDHMAQVESCLLAQVRLTRRGYTGDRLGDPLIVPAALLLPLYQLLGDVLIARERVERMPMPEPTPAEIEQPDASTGQTFTVDAAPMHIGPSGPTDEQLDAQP